MTDLDWSRLMRKGAHVARKVAREYPGVEASDIEQEIYLHCAEKKATILKANYNDTQLEGIMLRVARSYAGRERYAFIHYSSEWVYTPKEVRALFDEAFFDPILWETMPAKDDGLTLTAKGIVVSLWDISQAFDLLEVEDQLVITKKHNDRECTPLTGAEQKRYERAIDKVTQRINGRMAAKSETKTVSAETV